MSYSLMFVFREFFLKYFGGIFFWEVFASLVSGIVMSHLKAMTPSLNKVLRFCDTNIDRK